MAIDLEKLRKRYKARKPKKMGAKTIPFHQLRTNKEMILQFLPAISETTCAYWAIRRTFPTYWVDPEDDSKRIILHLPSPKMYDPAEFCPLGQSVSELYTQRDELENNGEDAEAKRIGAVASAHWTKPKMLLQCLVSEWSGVDDPDEDNPVKVICLTKQSSEVVEAGLETGDFMPCGSWEMPDLGDDEYDMDDFMFKCTPFHLKKTKQGGHNNYSASHYGGDSRYTQEQIDDVIENGLYSWDQLLPTEPTEEQYELMAELQAISIAAMLGENVDNTFDPEWEKELGLKGFEDTTKKEEDKKKPERKKVSRKSSEPSKEAKTKAAETVSSVKGRGSKSAMAVNLRKRIQAKADKEAASA